MKRDQSLQWHAPDVLDFTGARAAIVGGTGGIGRALARKLASKGAAVIVVGRQFRDAPTAGVEFMAADLSSMREARRVGRSLPAEGLDLVVFTTGIMAGPKREVTADGIERDLAVSYLSRLVILREIAGRLGQARAADARKPRVFVTGFPGSGQKANVDDLNSEHSYGRMTAHMNTVAGNEALVLDAAVRYRHFETFGLNPGFVSTGIRTNLFGGKNWLYHTVEWLAALLTKGADEYAAQIAPLFIAPELNARSGMMFDDKGRAILASGFLDKANVDRLIAASEGVVRRTIPDARY